MNATPHDDSAPFAGRIPVAVSERHAHLTQEAIEQLFCDKYRLHEHASASQPTQFAAQETVTLAGPGGRITEVRVIGPPRAENQIEISQSDARVLGVRVPLREAGDVEDTPGIVLEGPRASVRLQHGVIRTLRHLHLDPASARRHGLKDGDRVDVAEYGPHRQPLFCNVLVRVSATFKMELHLDPDESRASGLQSGAFVSIRRNIPAGRKL